jgi:hypothetical protein
MAAFAMKSVSIRKHSAKLRISGDLIVRRISASFARIPASHLQNQTLCVRGIRRVANKSACLLAPRTSLAVVSGLRVGSFAELFLRRRPRCLYSASSDRSADYVMHP